MSFGVFLRENTCADGFSLSFAVCQIGNSMESYAKVGSNPKAVTAKQKEKEAIFQLIIDAYHKARPAVVVPPPATPVRTPFKPLASGQ